MPAKPTKPSPVLADFLARVNMSELPAMSTHVRELLALTQSSRSAACELSRVILKDYSLTNKVLQVVNSAYYALNRRVGSISRAVMVLGFDAVRDLAAGIALFEDFVKAGLDKDEVSRLMTSAFLAAITARNLVVEKELNVQPEEAFICSLLRNLGKTMVCVYAPDLYRKVAALVAAGRTEEAAAEEVLGVSYGVLGGEIARSWNLAEEIAEAMDPAPLPPTGPMDGRGYLCCLADYTNRLVGDICQGRPPHGLLDKYGELFRTDLRQAVDAIRQAMETAEDISDAVRQGLVRLRLRARLQAVERGSDPSAAEAGPPPAATDDNGPAAAVEGLEALPVSSDKSVNDYIHDITETLMGRFDLNAFYVQLLEGLYRGIGFDRVVLLILEVRGRQGSLVGRFSLGDIPKGEAGRFRQPLDQPRHAMLVALRTGRDLVLPGDKQHAFPEPLRDLVAGRQVYLLPVRVDDKPIGLIYLDRFAARPRLTAGEIKTARLLRDFAVMAVRKTARRRS